MWGRMASAPKDDPKDKEIADLKAKHAEDMKWFAQPKKLLTEKIRLTAEVEELLKFKDEAEPLLAERDQIRVELDHAATELRKLHDNTEKLIDSLEDAHTDFHRQDSPYFEEGYSRRSGVMRALSAVSGFAVECGVKRRLRKPLRELLGALQDAGRGIRNPLLEPAKSKRVNKGRPMTTEVYREKSLAAFAVTGLIELGETRKKAYDIVAEASGFPRGELKSFRQDLIAPKRRGSTEAQLAYDMTKNIWDELLNENKPESSLKLSIENILNAMRENRDIREN